MGYPWQPEIPGRRRYGYCAYSTYGQDRFDRRAVSIPTRHIHQVIEMADRNDIDAAIRLLTACIEGLMPIPGVSIGDFHPAVTSFCENFVLKNSAKD